MGLKNFSGQQKILALAAALLLLAAASVYFIAGRETSESGFGDDSEINKACSIDSDCRLPGSYALKSDCPYEMRCKDSKCTVVCPWLEK